MFSSATSSPFKFLTLSLSFHLANILQFLSELNYGRTVPHHIHFGSGWVRDMTLYVKTMSVLEKMQLKLFHSFYFSFNLYHATTNTHY